MNTQIDKSDLRQSIIDSPKQLGIGIEIAKDIKVEGNFKKLVVSGMGGSALPAEIIRNYLSENELEIINNRTYSISKKYFEDTLHFISSFSGNTEETISCLKEAIENNLKIVVFSNGGKLEDIAKENNIPFVKLPDCIQPRYATGYFVSSMLKVLSNSGLTENQDSAILSIQDYLPSKIASFEEKGHILAKKLVSKTPVIYSTDKFKSIAMILKIKLNENAKTPAFWNVYPELNHNEMVGWTQPQGKFHILTFLDESHPQIKKRMQITADLLREKGIETDFIEIEEEDILTSIFSSIIMIDWISYYLAIEYGQDPIPVDMVERFKTLL